MRMTVESSGMLEEGADQSTFTTGDNAKEKGGDSDEPSEATIVVSAETEEQQPLSPENETEQDGKDEMTSNTTDRDADKAVKDSAQSDVGNGMSSNCKDDTAQEETAAECDANDAPITDSQEQNNQTTAPDEADPPAPVQSSWRFFKRRRGRASDTTSASKSAEADAAQDVMNSDRNDENSDRESVGGSTLSASDNNDSVAPKSDGSPADAPGIGDTGEKSTELIHNSDTADRDSSDESEPASTAPSFHSQESMIASQSMALNDAFLALETMRKANLDLELASMGKVDHRCCTACLRAQWRKEEARAAAGEKRRTWKHNFARRRAALPCLVCAAPVCSNHSCPEFRKDKVTICGECSPLFSVDFIFDIVFNDDKEHRRACIDKVVDSYDRAVLIIKYSSQFIDDIAKALRDNTTRDNSVALGSSGIGLMSGITGAAAAAVHIAAAAAAGAAILSPAGPPLFIASLIFGGTAAAASTSSEAVSYYSEPNQMASRLLALHELINSLLQVTVVLKDALINGRINLSHYVERKQKKKKRRKLSSADSQATDSDADDDAEQVPSDTEHDATRVEEEADDATTVTAQTDITDGGSEDPDDSGIAKKDSFNEQLEAAASQLSLDEADTTTQGDCDFNSDKEPSLAINANEEGNGSNVTKEKDVKMSSKEAPSKPQSTKSDKKASAGAKHETKVVVAQQDNVRSAICRATTNAMKAASAASAACGVLSVTTIILEAKNMTDSLERMKTNECQKADIIEAIKAEIDKLPDTSLIAEECESYLNGSADEAQPAALSTRNRKESQERGAPRVGLPIKLAD